MDPLRTAEWSTLVCAFMVLVVLDGPVRAEVTVRPDVMRLIDEFRATLPPSIARTPLVETEVPTLGCPQDGMADPIEAPRLPTSARVIVPSGLETSLTLYSAFEDPSTGVLGPRGWDCFGTYGSGGSTLYITPRRLSDPILDRREKVAAGPFVIRTIVLGETSGRDELYRISARIFPRARPFIERVEGLDEAKRYIYKPWPNDTLKYLSDFAVNYVTPARSVGLGTELGLASGRLPTYGLAHLHLDPELYLYGLAIRLEERERRLYAPIIVAQIAGMPRSAQQQPRAVGRGARPYELTSRGSIAADVTEAYKSAIEACSRETAGNAPHGSTFVACLRQQIQKESAELEAVYRGTLSYLNSAPSKIARLRRAERAWVQFQDENCAFARDVAPPEYAQEFLYYCELRSTMQNRQNVCHEAAHRCTWPHRAANRSRDR
jgi:uncharacterized protein YecT (DUF1311 family)